MSTVGMTQGSEPSPDRNLPALITVFCIAICLAIYYPILKAMVYHWRVVPDYSHGFLIVPLALYFAYEKRRDLARCDFVGSWWGLLPLTIGVVLLGFGQLGTLLPPLRAGFIFTLAGLVLLLLGTRAFRLLLFPLGFLLLMVPLPQSLVNTVAFPLQLTAAKWAVASLQLLGIPALLQGNIIDLAHDSLFVDEACSGLRSLMALITLGVVFAKFFQAGHLVLQIILVLSAIPIAVIVNSFRVTVTGILTHFYGIQMAGGFIHEFQGMITFSIAFLLLMAESRAFTALSGLRPAR